MTKESGTENKVFDRDGLLHRIMDDKTILNKLIYLAVEDLPNQCAKIKKANEMNDPDKLRSSAHLVKGAAANIGAESLRTVAYELEKKGKSGDLTKCGDLIITMEKELKRLINVLHEELKKADY